MTWNTVPKVRLPKGTLLPKCSHMLFFMASVTQMSNADRACSLKPQHPHSLSRRVRHDCAGGAVAPPSTIRREGAVRQLPRALPDVHGAHVHHAEPRHPPPHVLRGVLYLPRPPRPPPPVVGRGRGRSRAAVRARQRDGLRPSSDRRDAPPRRVRRGVPRRVARGARGGEACRPRRLRRAGGRRRAPQGGGGGGGPTRSRRGGRAATGV